MSNFLVTTLPLSIKQEIKIGALTSIVYASIIAKKTECESMLYLNSLNCYKAIDYDISNLIKQMEYYKIDIDKVVLDRTIIHENLENLGRLYTVHRVNKQKRKVFRCKCGRVELLSDSLQKHTVGKVYDLKEGMRCKICGTECECFEDEVLTFKINTGVKAQVAPRCSYENNFVQFDEQYGGKELMISRFRKTGIEFEGFNIDIDFFWSLFVGTPAEKNIVIVSSNSHLFKLYVINQIADFFDKRMIAVIHPRIVRKSGEHISSEINKYDPLYRYLILLYAPKWKTQKCFYDIGMMKYIAKIRNIGREKLYEYLLTKFNKDEYYSELYYWIENKLNLQKNIIEVLD